MKADPFAGLSLHHMKVDWKDVTLTRDKLSNLFMGVQAHWNNDLWVREKSNQFGPAGEDMTRIEIEQYILKSAPVRQWGGVSPWGKPYYKHMLTLIKLMFPRTDITDTLADVVMFFCIAAGNGLKLVNLIGGQNMSKTAGTCRIAFATMFINPEFTRWTVSNPFDNVADSGVWGEIEDLWDQLKICWPGGIGTKLFPEGFLYSNRKIEFIPNRPRVARIELQNIKHTGKGKGAKSRKGADNEDVGIFGEIIDEINEIDNPAFLKRVVNSASQRNYIAVTSQNFKDPADMGGQITEPIPRFGGPDSFEKLNVDDDLWWHSKDDGITLRLDGHNSANILAERVIYSYLFQQEDRERIARSGGEQSPMYMSQVRSFPVQGATANSLLSKPKLSASRHMDQFYALQSIGGIGGFADPAFGGNDSAVYGMCKWGRGVVTDGDGKQVQMDLIVFPEPFIVLKLDRGAFFPGKQDFWMKRLQALGLDTSNETEGAEISYEDQIAIQCLEHNRRYGVPAANFGYDFSMRPDIVTSMNKYIGFSSVAFNYNMPPQGVPILDLKAQTSKDDGDSRELCKNRCTELGMLAADMYLTKCLRGGENIQTATLQLCRTRKETVNRKYVIEGKPEYKARWNNVSPDMRDVLMGLCGIAAMRGFRGKLLVANKGGSQTGILELLRKKGKFMARKVPKLQY